MMTQRGHALLKHGSEALQPISFPRGVEKLPKCSLGIAGELTLFLIEL